MLRIQRRLYVSSLIAIILMVSIGAVSYYFIHSFGVQVRSLAGTMLPAIDMLIANTQRNLMLVYLMILGAGLILLLFFPHRATIPFKKLFLAFREAEEGNLSLRLPVEGNEEMRDFISAFNRLMGQLENLDDMRLKKIAFEQRRFEALANVLDAAVVVCNVEGQILFVNSQVYRVFDVTSKQVVGASLEQVPLPPPLVRLLLEAISSKERVEDMPWELIYQKEDEDVRIPVVVDIHPVARHTGEVVNMLVILEERDKPRSERSFRRERN